MSKILLLFIFAVLGVIILLLNTDDPHIDLKNSILQNSDKRILKLCPHCSDFNALRETRESAVGQPGTNQIISFIKSREMPRAKRLVSEFPASASTAINTALASVQYSESKSVMPGSAPEEPWTSTQMPIFSSEYTQTLAGQPFIFEQLPYKVSGEIEVPTPATTVKSYAPSVAIRFLQVRSAFQ